MGLYSIDRCSSLGRRINFILKENDQTLKTVQTLKKSCTQMTSTLLASAAGKSPNSKAEFSEACRFFDIALQNQEKIAKKGEVAKLTKELRKIHTAYMQDAWKLLEDSGRNRMRSQLLGNKVSDQTTTILDLADSILTTSQNEVALHSSISEKEINGTVRLLILAMIIAIVLAIYTSIKLSRSVLTPIASLTESIRQVGEGDLDQSLALTADDELGRLAATFNKMASQLRVYRSNHTQKLQRLNLTIEHTLSSFPDPIFVLNAEGSVEFRNPAADLLAVKLLFSGVRRLPEQVEKLVKESFSTGQDYLPTLFKYSITLHFDNSDHHFMPRIVLLRDKENAPFGAAVILEDITRMRLVDEIKNNLVSTVSHELKTPLTSIRMAVYLLLEKMIGPLNDKQEKLLQVAREDSERLLKMLNDLLDLARLEEGPPEMNLATVTPHDLIQETVLATASLAAESHIKIDVHIDPCLPHIQADRDRICYVFNNLLTNAIKYSPPENIVHFSATICDEKSLRFSIRDHGTGIPEEHRNRIFEKFYRIAGSKKTGAGLGLSIAQEIVRAHNGEIGVQCPPDGGSEFYVILPTTVNYSNST